MRHSGSSLWCAVMIIAFVMVFIAARRSAPVSVNDGVRARLVADHYARTRYGEKAKVVSCDNMDMYGSGFVTCYGVAGGEPFEFRCGYQSVSTGCVEIDKLP